MKNKLCEAFWVIFFVGLAGLFTWGCASSIVEDHRSDVRVKVRQRQITVESVRRGYAELVVNTNTGDFEVRLKEVAP